MFVKSPVSKSCSLASSVIPISTSNSFFSKTRTQPPAPRLRRQCRVGSLIITLWRQPPPQTFSHVFSSASLPTRRRSPLAATCPPLISFSDPNLPDLLLSAASQLGFFQLTNHNIPPQLANSAESESLSLLELTRDKKRSYFPTHNWPVGFKEDDGENGESFCLDAESFAESSELRLGCLLELTRGLEKLELEMIETLARVVGFDNPLKEDLTRLRTSMWLDESLEGESSKPATCGRFYQYVVGLQYQIRCQKYLMPADSGWVTVGPPVDSVMVTIGDVAQVWSNGKLKKVRGRPRAISKGDGSTSRCISMSLLLTLSPESIISPLLLPNAITKNNRDADEIPEDEEEETHDHIFTSFSFEDYAWRSIKINLITHYLMLGKVLEET